MMYVVHIGCCVFNKLNILSQKVQKKIITWIKRSKLAVGVSSLLCRNLVLPKLPFIISPSACSLLDIGELRCGMRLRITPRAPRIAGVLVASSLTGSKDSKTVFRLHIINACGFLLWRQMQTIADAAVRRATAEVDDTFWRKAFRST